MFLQKIERSGFLVLYRSIKCFVGLKINHLIGLIVLNQSFYISLHQGIDCSVDKYIVIDTSPYSSM